MKVAHAFINAFESARVQDKALFRHFGFSTSIFWAENLATSNALQQVPQLYRRSPYRLFSNGRYSERPYKQRFPKLPSVYTPRLEAQASQDLSRDAYVYDNR